MAVLWVSFFVFLRLTKRVNSDETVPCLALLTFEKTDLSKRITAYGPVAPIRVKFLPLSFMFPFDLSRTVSRGIKKATSLQLIAIPPLVGCLCPPICKSVRFEFQNAMQVLFDSNFLSLLRSSGFFSPVDLLRRRRRTDE